MLSSEIIKQISRIEIKTKHIVNSLFGGEYHSAFKGTGMEFAEVREYIVGDDIRNIDWNVTARAGHPYIKTYEEERELIVMLAIDVSPSVFFGTKRSLKSDIIIELASILSFSAIKNNDKVGLLLFTDHVEKFITPNKGRSHVLRVIREMIYHPATGKNTNISSALEHIHKILKRKCIIFLISDFWDTSYRKNMKLINKKHDLINIQIHDPAEENFPNLGLIKVHDVETQKSRWINTNSKSFLTNYINHINDINKQFINYCKQNNIDLIPINTNQGFIKPLELFFYNRINVSNKK